MRTSVLLITSVYPPAIGGPSLQTKEIAQALANRGHAVSVLAFRTGGTPPVLPGVALREIDGGDRTKGGWLSRNVELFRAIDRAVGEVRPDVVHVQACDGNFSLYAGIAARRRGVPRMVKFSADMVWNQLNRDCYRGISYERIHSSSWKARLLTREQAFIFAQYDFVWATSPFQEEALRKIYGLPPERIRLLPNLVCTSGESSEPREDPPRRRQLTALVVSRVVPWKGIDDCIRCLSFPGVENVVLRVVGGGTTDYIAELRRIAASLNVSDRVDFVGAVDPTRVRDDFERADILLLASRYEPFGIVLVQAMAAGLAIVATRTGGIPSIVEDGVTGLLVPVDRPQDLANAVARLAGDPSLRRRLGGQGRKVCHRFSVEHRFDDLFALYESLAGSARSPGGVR